LRSWCCGLHARTRAGATGGFAASLASSASKCRRQASAACSPGRTLGRRLGARGELARVSARAGRGHRRVRLLYRRDRVSAPLLRPVLDRAGQPPRLVCWLHKESDRRVGHPAGAQPRPRLRRPRRAFPGPRPRQQLQRALRRGVPQRGHPNRQDARASTEGQRGRGAPTAVTSNACFASTSSITTASDRTDRSNSGHPSPTSDGKPRRRARSSAATDSAASSTSTTDPPPEI